LILTILGWQRLRTTPDTRKVRWNMDSTDMSEDKEMWKRNYRTFQKGVKWIFIGAAMAVVMVFGCVLTVVDSAF